MNACRKRNTLLNSILFAALSLSLLASVASLAKKDPSEAMRAVEGAMRAREFADAIEMVDEDLQRDDGNSDKFLYLKARSQFYRDDYKAAVETAAGLIDEYPESPWYHKARFLKAQALVEQKEFKAAEEIYEEEAHRLLSSKRKKDIAGVVIKFADRLATKPDPDALNAPQANYGKAYKLYNKALQMEIGRELKDELMFKKAAAIQKTGNAPQAVRDFEAYLREFDPRWAGLAGTSAQLQENPPPPGKHILQARLHLAEALLASNQFKRSRWEAEDLLKKIDSKEPAQAQLHADTEWLLIKAFRMPQPQANELERAIKATREFLANHPADPRSVQAAYYIPKAYENRGRPDEAITAYRAFIDSADYNIPEGEAAGNPISDKVKTSPLELQEKFQKEALYKIGRIRSSQKIYDNAIEVWQRYVNRYPNGPHWSASQNGILNAEFQKGVQALAEEEYDTAVSIFKQFLKDHPLDTRAAQILFTYGQINYAQAAELEKKDSNPEEVEGQYQKAIGEWKRLISKYPQSNEASLALYRTGRIYEEKLDELDKALESYRRLNWGTYSAKARQCIAEMTDKKLKVGTERKFRTDEIPVVNVETRNIEKLTVRIYSLDVESYFRKTHTTRGVDALDVSLIEPDKSWEVEMDDYAEYKPLEQEIEIPFDNDEAGAYVVNVSSGDWEAITLVIRSDLDLIFKTSRRELLVFVQNMLSKEPASGVKLLLSDGKKIFATGETGKDGVYKAKFKELKNLANAGVLAVADGNVAAHKLDLEGMGFSSGLSPRGYIYTERPAYRPGEGVALRGILRDVVDGSYAVPDGSFKLSISDPQGRILREEEVELSEFGTFYSEFDLPESAGVGEYTILASRERENKSDLQFTADFKVQHFKLEKIRLSLDLERDVYFRGEKVEGTISAEYYWGEPLVNAPLKYTLPDGRSYTTQTDENGNYTFSFETTGMTPGKWLDFSATLTADNVSEQRRAFLAVLGFSASVSPSQSLVVSGEPVDVTIATTSADGDPIGRNVTLKVLRRIARKQDKLLDMIPWLSSPQTESAERTVEEHELKTDPDTGEARTTLNLEDGGDYILRVSGHDRFEQTVSAQTTLKISDADDDTRLRIFADSATLKVGDDAELRLHSRLDPALALITYEGEEILRYDVVEIDKGYNPIEFEVGNDLFPNFRIAVASMDGRELRSAAKHFTVERQLKIAIKPRKEQFLPGESGQVELTVTDQLGKPVQAELSLALVNQALFAAFPDQTPPILQFFQRDARRHAEFRAAATCGFEYQGQTRKVVKALLDEKERLARRAEDKRRLAASQVFRMKGLKARRARLASAEDMEADMPAPSADYILEDKELDESGVKSQRGLMSYAGAGQAAAAGPEQAPPSPEPRREVAGAGFWLPSVLTDADGKALVTVPMPETTTEWRLTTRGCTPETLVGQATNSVLTRKDFFVEIKTPHTVREGDELRVLARVHNMSDYEGPVTVVLDIVASDAEESTLAHRESELEISAAAGATVVFEGGKVPLVDDLIIKVTARAEAKLADVLEREIEVQPWGMEYADHHGGVARSNARALLTLPDRKYSRRWLTVQVSPNLEETVIEMALSPQPVLRGGPNIVHYGYHPGSELLATVKGLEYGRRGTAGRERLDRLTAKARRLIAELVQSQREDGGWAWYNATGKNSDWPASCRTYWALCAARGAGLAVNEDSIAKATAYLQQRFQALGASDHEGKSIILHALSLNKDADFASLNRLYRARNELGNEALAYTALAFANMERQPMAEELADILDAKFTPINEGDDQIGYWKNDAKNPYLKSDVEATALGLLLSALVKPESEKCREAAKYLLQRRGCYGWQPAKARGPAVAALAQWFGSAAQERSDCRVAIEVNGREMAEIASNDGTMRRIIEIPQGALTNGENRVVFKMQGRGEYAYAATLRGFSPTIKDPKSFRYPYVRHRRYYHSELRYRGCPIGVHSSSQVRNLESGKRSEVRIDFLHNSHEEYLIVEEPIPAGATLVEGSVHGNFNHYELRGNRIVFFYQRGCYLQDIRYELLGYAPGDFRVLPTVIRDAMQPDRMRIGSAGKLAVLAPGEESPDPYKMNNAELFKLGRLKFNDGLYGEALDHLSTLYKRDHDYNERELARMLLWIYTLPEHYDAGRIVEMFEVLRERHPELEIPYDKILVVGRAYRDIGEYERAWLVFRATIDASFVTDSNVSAVLEDEGRFLGSIDYQKRLWLEYPDSANVVSSYFAISQSLYNKAPNAHEMPEEDGEQPDRITMLVQACDILRQFMTLYPNDPLTDDAAFSLANAELDLKNYELVVDLCERFLERYTDSEMVSSFRYMAALGYFWQNDYEKALRNAKEVAHGESKDKKYAQYIVGQIYHAWNNPGEAINWYKKVENDYPDAKQAIGFFESKSIGMEEVNIFKPGEQVVFDLDYRNIKEAYLQIYRVDLMKLYLQEKNLSNITRIHLAGITPERERTIELGDGRDYADKEREVELDVEKDGAYLVICRGDDLFTSGLVLVTPLTMEVQESAKSGRVRVNVRDKVDDSYRGEVHIKAIGSANDEFRSGETDLRGIFVADKIRGEATVIARDGKARYAFYRGGEWLGAPKQQAPRQETQQRQHEQQMDYQYNLRQKNSEMQIQNVQQFDQMRRKSQKGVQVKKAF